MNATRYFQQDDNPGLLTGETHASAIKGMLNFGWSEVYVVPRPDGALAEEYQVTRDATEWRVTMPNGDVHHFDPTDVDTLRAEAQALLFLIEEVESHEAARAEHERNNLIWRWISWFNSQHEAKRNDAMVSAIQRLVANGQVPPDA